MVSANLKKMEMEKNNFIKELSREQFDGILTNKYKKAFVDYFDGNITDAELNDRINKNLEMITVYENGDHGKIDSNQYLYSAIVDVALNYYNVATGFETCLNKVNLLASYLQLCALADCKMESLHDLIYDAFFIHANFTGSDADKLLLMKLDKIKTIVLNCDSVFDELIKHEDLIREVEKETGNSFVDELHIDESIKSMYSMCKDNFAENKHSLLILKQSCVDELTGVELDIVNGKIIGGASE